MKFSVLISLVASSTIEKSSWNYNPQCPTEDAAAACEDDCISIQADCVYNCRGNQDCIRQCSRDYATCTDACPCYPGCYNGCPCTYESQYCKGCEARFEKEHNVCKDLNKKTLNSCLDQCSYDEQCENECMVLYHFDAKDCPCMDHCQNGCPCDNFDCDLALNITDPVYGLESMGVLEPVGPTFNGECIDTSNDLRRGEIYAHRSPYYSYNSTHVRECSKFCLQNNPRTIASEDQNSDPEINSAIEETTGGYERYYTTDSPNNREIDQEFQYFGFDPYDSRCWCGNTPPFYPRAMQDCENGRRATSRIYSQTNSKQLCDYNVIEGGYYENYKLVRQILSRKQSLTYPGYKNFQQCWTRFKCPDDMLAYWRRATFYTESGYDYVIFYGVNNGDYRKYSGSYGSSSSWYTLYDNEITFEFTADGSQNYYLGFEILLMCR